MSSLMLRVKCACGCDMKITDTKIMNASTFICPICKAQIPDESLQKIKACCAQIKECQVVKREHEPDKSYANLMPLFTVDFENQ